MSIKKEVMDMIKNKRVGSVTLNCICALDFFEPMFKRSDYDYGINLRFKAVNDVCFSPNIVTIESRDYDGILDEVTTAINKFCMCMSDDLTKAVRSGRKR